LLNPISLADAAKLQCNVPQHGAAGNHICSSSSSMCRKQPDHKSVFHSGRAQCLCRLSDVLHNLPQPLRVRSRHCGNQTLRDRSFLTTVVISAQTIKLNNIQRSIGAQSSCVCLRHLGQDTWVRQCVGCRNLAGQRTRGASSHCLHAPTGGCGCVAATATTA
jgi:hypothetical protein